MWKKDEGTPTPTPTPRQAETTPRPDAPRRTHATSERAVIGRSISIHGDVTGDEDLLIQGQVEGSVDLELHAVTVGSDGRVKANITGRVITVEGEVEGDLRAQEQITLRSSARVNGDINAPRVVLDDGASFRGLVDMGDPARAGRSVRRLVGREGRKRGELDQDRKAPTEREPLVARLVPGVEQRGVGVGGDARW